MKVLKITGECREKGETLGNSFEGFAYYDEYSKCIEGYLCRNTNFCALQTTSYIVGSYDENTLEFELLVVHTSYEDHATDSLLIFEDVRKEGIWGNCDLKYGYFGVVGSATVSLEVTSEQRVTDVERAVDHLEAYIDDIELIREIDDYSYHVHTKFPGAFRDYFNN